MSQKVVILRGPACSGKTTISREIRNYDKKIAWLSIDKVKPLFSDFKDETLDDVNKSAVTILDDLLKRDFSVIVDGIFKKPNHFADILAVAKDKDIPVVAYQLECSLETLKKRDKDRDGVKYWGPLGDELVESLYKTVENNPIEGLTKINTEEKSLADCVEIIRKNFD